MRIEMNKILKTFISHSSLDRELVLPFINNILVLGLGISIEDIYCSSISGLGTKAGEDFTSDIKTKLKGADLVFLIFSDNFYESITCVQEMGAAWILNKAIIPLYYENIAEKKVGYVLNTIIKIKLFDPASLDNLKETLEQRYGINGSGTSQWNSYKEEFIKQINLLYREDISHKINQAGKRSALNERELLILKTIFHTPGHSNSIAGISLLTQIAQPTIKILIEKLEDQNLVFSVGSDYQLTDKGVMLVEGIE